MACQSTLESGVVYLQVDADGGEGLFGVGQDAVGRVVADAVGRDYDLIAEGVLPGVARGASVVRRIALRRGGFAAGGQSEDHGERKRQSQEFPSGFLLIFTFSSLFWVSFIKRRSA